MNARVRVFSSLLALAVTGVPAEVSAAGSKAKADATVVVTITVPPRLALDLNTSSFRMTAADAFFPRGSSGDPVKATIRSNNPTTVLRVQASPPTSQSGQVIPLQYLKSRVHVLHVLSGESYTPPLADLLTFQGGTSGTVVSFDYALENAWLVSPGDYVSIIHYSLVAP